MTLDGSFMGNNVASLMGGDVHCSDFCRLVASNSVFTTSQASSGGILSISDQGNVTISQSLLSHGSATNGGGVYVAGTGALLSMTDSTTSFHVARSAGGGFYSDQVSSLSLVNTKILNCTSLGDGGGLWLGVSGGSCVSHVISIPSF